MFSLALGILACGAILIVAGFCLKASFIAIGALFELIRSLVEFVIVGRWRRAS